MVNSRGITRLGMMALALGIGAAVVHSAGTAAANPSTDWLWSTDTLLSGGLPEQLPDLNLAISFNGMSLVSDGSAVADSGTAGNYDLAIAYGDGATAFANNGTGNYALAIGPAASAVAAHGNYDSATALSGIADAGYGNHDVAFAIGDNAGALGGDYDSALQWGKDAFALAGYGNGNFADVMGAGSGDFTGGGFNGYDLGYAGGTTSLFANYGIASVLGNNSNAVAGNDLLNGGTTVGDHDIASVFGQDNVTANATGAGGLYDISSASGHETGGAAVASADAANAATSSGFLAAANTAGANSDFLSGSTHALILGPTGISTPDAAYISDAENLYLYPNGYDGTTATTLPLTTPETNDFNTSVPQGETILENAILADYNAGDMGCDASGVCSDPLTIFTYSQSSAVASLAEPQIAADGVPTDALRFVMLGANPTGVPDNLYPTEVYNIHGDTFAEPGVLGTSPQALLFESELHDAYLGLTPTEIASATPTVEGMTTVYEIPTLTTTELWQALLAASATGT
jgi:PE-PPE domain